MELEIKKHLKSDVEVICLESVDSTNTYAKNLIKGGKKNAFLVAAKMQTLGRGRQGKSFYSPADTGIYMSLGVQVDESFQNIVTSTTAASVAVCRAIEELTDIKPQIKWVNDIYAGGKKVCGILTECISDARLGSVKGLVIGVGINVETYDFPSDLTNASQLGAGVDKALLIARITDNLFALMNSEYSEFIDYYKAHSFVIGKKINCIECGKSTPATAVDIDNEGGLVVRLENGELTTLRTGEITIRLA